MSRDHRTRRLGRSDDPAAHARYARELLRQGQWRLLSTEDLLDQELVGADRTALARRVLEAGWSDWTERWSRRRRDLIRDAAGLLGNTLPARLAADYAAHVPQAPVGLAAIEAARRWVDGPAEKNRLAAQDAAAAALLTAGADAFYAAAAAASAALAAAAADYADYADYAANAAASAAAAADWAAGARAAVGGGDAAAADAEQTWQKWRLVRYIVAPDFPTPIPITDAP